MAAEADRNLLFGLIALQVGLVDQSQLVAAFQAWARDKSRPLAEHLAGSGRLDADARDAVEAMVALHLKAHGGDAGRSLAAIPTGRQTRERLGSVGEPELEATLARLGSSSAATEPGDDRTATYAAGTAAADGQRFRVLRPHARGGLGAVFVALDAELRREVALKQILDGHADDPVSRQRFLLEAEITGGLEHPGIVPVYGLGTYQDGRPYYAMRFIRGDSLKEAIERFHADDSLRKDPGRRSLELRKLLRRFIDVCNAIEYAHSRGVLHRDIKPGNIIVGKHGETLVVDWGLAKSIGRAEVGAAAGDERLLTPSAASGSAETLPGSALGTPAYMSPEQARGDLDSLGPRSDVYSLGATLFCLLCGRPPFEGDDLGATLRKVQAGDFPRPRQLDPAIDRALEAVCLKAMATRPDGRYGSARELADDVERWMADEPVSARREPWAARARRWVARNRTPVAAGVAALVVAAAGLAAVLAIQARVNARLAESLANETRARDDEKAARERADRRFAIAKQALDAFHRGASQDLILQRAEFKDLRRQLLQTGVEFYQTLFEEAAADPRITDHAVKTLATDMRRIAQIQEQIGDYAGAEANYRRALAIFEKTPNVTIPSENAQWHQHIADTLMARGRPEDALKEMELAVELTGTGPESSWAVRRFSGYARLYLGQLQWRLGRVDDALKSLEAARTLMRERTDSREGQRSSNPWLDLVGAEAITADVLSGTGRFDEALTWRAKALSTWEHLLTLPADKEADHYALESYRDAALAALGRDLARVGRPDEARPKLEAAARGLEAVVAGRQGDPGVIRRLASAHADLAQLLNATDPDEAARHADRAATLIEGLDPKISDDHYQRAALTANRFAMLARTSPEPGRTDAERAELDRLAAAAVAALDDAFGVGFRCAPLLRNDPAFEPIRSRPEFLAFVGRVEEAARRIAPAPGD